MPRDWLPAIGSEAANEQSLRLWPGTIGRDMVYTLVSMYLMYYLSDVLVLSKESLLRLTGIFVLMRIFDAINDPFMGMIVDNTRSRFGKFKPWIAIGALLSGLFTVLLFTDFGLTEGAFVASFSLIYLFWGISFTANDIAYWSMLPALSDQQKEREKIGAFARICANIGLFSVVVGIVPITQALAQRLGSLQKAYAALSMALVAAMLLFQALMLFLVKEAPRQGPQASKTSASALFKVIFKNDQLLWTTLAMGLFMVGYTTTTSFGLYYFEYIFGDVTKYGIFALILGVSQILALLAFPFFSRHFKRKQLYQSASLLVVLAYLIFYLAKDSMALVGLAGVLLFSGQAFIQLIMLMFIADCVEYGEYRLGRRNDSVTLSLQPLINKFGGAIASGIVGFTVVYSGVKDAQSAADMQPEGIRFFKNSMLIMPILLIALSYLIYHKKYKIDEAYYEKMLAHLKAERQKEARP